MPNVIELFELPLEFVSDSKKKISGELKTLPENFIVEEIPLYFPSGQGNHLYLWIEKRDVSAEQLLQHISHELNISRNVIGAAGLKDRRAITRQWISIPVEHETQVERLNNSQVKILKAEKHVNKLKTGHLKGNRFEIIFKTSQTDALSTAKELSHHLSQTGYPNYYGDQRFGIDGETLTAGMKLLSGQMKPADIPPRRRKFFTRLALSSVQSALFNAVLSERIKQMTFNRVLLGDVLQVVASGGPFVSTDPVVDQNRFDAREVITSGPLFGPKMKMPMHHQLEFELSFLKQSGLSLDHFRQFKKLTMGTRRPLLMYLDSMRISEAKEGLKFLFELPKGAYATTILREFIK